MITQHDLSASVATLLSATGATSMSDDSGKLPLHYACAFGISNDVLKVLTSSYRDGINKTDDKGFIPFHLALANSNPDAVRHLIKLDRNVVNSPVESLGRQLPIQLLGRRAATIRPNEEGMMRDAMECEECVEEYLRAEPEATADFVTLLQSLPLWLRDVAVVTPYVKKVLNKKISQAVHTAFLWFDFAFLILNITSFTLAAKQVISAFCYTNEGNDEFKFAPNNYYNGTGTCIESNHTCYGVPCDKDCCTASTYSIDGGWLMVLLVCACYFLFRELVQVASLASLGLFKTWLYDFKNLIDIGCITASYYWGISMYTGQVHDDKLFRIGVCITIFLFWLWILNFLKSTFIGFAVFIEGVAYVVKRLVVFLVALGAILICFAMMFVIVFKKTEKCCDPKSDEDFFPYCDLKFSLLAVYTMLLGEVNDTYFYGNGVATFLFALFIFLVAILLANVLIAIVTDSYGVVKNERSAIVFWSNRLDFVAEIDVIADGVLVKRLMCSTTTNKYLEELWNDMIQNFEGHHPNVLLEVVTFFFIALVWIPIGLVTAGIFWPPQVREYFLERSYTEIKKADLQNMEVEALEKEVHALKQDVKTMISKERDQCYAMTSEMTEVKKGVMVEIDAMKEIMSELFALEQQRPTHPVG
mmetsp:Transcript_26808/g.32484  ORF Transcript_26808/g.32484 Transcript_26808/m.32484 type:complete len:643 (+) Transcript_26808:548-2476(+)